MPKHIRDRRVWQNANHYKRQKKRTRALWFTLGAVLLETLHQLGSALL